MVMKRLILFIILLFSICFSASAQFNNCGVGFCPSTFGNGFSSGGGYSGPPSGFAFLTGWNGNTLQAADGTTLLLGVSP